MNKIEAAARVASLSQHLESFLTEKGMRFSRQSVSRRPREIFDIVCDSHEKGLIENWITVYVHDELIFIESAVPVTSLDNHAVAAMVNRLNINYPMGSFQFDIRDGELNWTHYLAARQGAWPGNDMMMAALKAAQEMAGVLYRELLSISGASNSPEA